MRGTLLSIFMFAFLIRFNGVYGQVIDPQLPTPEQVARKMFVVDSLNALARTAETSQAAYAKTAVTSANSDCQNAISICTNTYSTTASYDDYGFIQDLPTTTCLLSREQKTVWYIFTVQNSGSFTFTINTLKDYDFALYNITTSSCANINNGTLAPVRCNFSATYGNTGLTLPVAGGSLSYSASQPPFMPGINVTAGETYVLVLDNFTLDATGYTITFGGAGGGGGTAQIFDNVKPLVASSGYNCATNTIRLNFNEPVKCSSVIPANFAITANPGGWSIASVTPVSCGGGASYTTAADITLTPGTGNGVLSLQAQNVADKCDNTLNPVTTSFNVVAPFTITGGAICIGNNITINGPAMPAGYTYLWSNGATTQNITVSPATTTTYTVTVTAPGTGCTRSANATVNTTPTPVVDATPSTVQVCPAGTSNVTATSTVDGSPCPDCIYEWVLVSGGPIPPPLTVGPAANSTKTLPVGVYQVRSTKNGCLSTYKTITITQAVPNPTTPSCDVIYVTPTGTGTGLEKTSPTNIQNALSLATCRNVVIKMQTGDYTINEPLNVNSFVTIEGGFDPGFTQKRANFNPGFCTRIIRTAGIVDNAWAAGGYTASDPSGGTAPRVTIIRVASGATGFRFQDLRLEISTDAAAGSRITHYGIYLGNGAGNYNIVRCFINTQRGANGVNGTHGTNWDGSSAGGANYWNGTAVVGTIPGPAAINGATVVSGSTGGAGGGPAGAPRSGGSGGNGGTSGCSPGANGIGGRDHLGNLIANFGTGGPCATGGLLSWACNGGCDDNPANRGNNGTAGADGANGANGTNGGPASYTAGFFVPGTNGGNGTLGNHGTGGGGGGGGGRDNSWCGSDNGMGGGGGGQGGERATAAGTGAIAGGGSFGIYRYNNGAGGNVRDCQFSTGIAAGSAGTGGRGGLGQNGGNGGTGGPACDGGRGGNGGAGGRGGHSGVGGNAAAGQTANVYSDGGTALVTNTTLNLTGQPQIIVANINCTQLPISMQRTSGPVTWQSAGTGTTAPAFPTGSLGTINTTYGAGQTGRKTIVNDAGAQTYTDFHNILIDPPSVGIALASPTAVCSNESFIVSSSVQGTPGMRYRWFEVSVSPNLNRATPATLPTTWNTNSSQTFTYTNTSTTLVGTVVLECELESECCGILTPRPQVTITVNPIPAVPTISGVTICPTNSVTLTPTAPIGVNFRWTTHPADAPLAIGGSYTTPLLSSSTVYRVRTIGPSGCESNFTTVTVTVNPTPIPTGIPASRCGAGSVTLGVVPVPGAEAYIWHSGSCAGPIVQNSLSTTYTTPTLVTTTNYYVQVKMPGCDPSACATVTATITGAPTNPIVWSGAISNDWHTVGNWVGGCLPTCADNVLFPTVGVINEPRILANQIANCRNITIQSGRTLRFDLKSVLRVCGNWQQDAGANLVMFSGPTGQGAVHFVGSTAQTVKIDQPGTQFNEVVISNSMAMTGAPHIQLLNTSAENLRIRTDGSITFVNGVVQTQFPRMIDVENSAIASVTGHNINSYVWGTIRRSISAAGGSYDFPVGDNHEAALVGNKGYQLANINFTTATSVGTLTANFTPVPQSGPNPTNECGNDGYDNFLDNGYWTITAAGAPVGDYNTTLYNRNYTPAGMSWTVQKRNPGPWSLVGDCDVTSTAAVTKRNNMTGFSDFATAYDITPYPVELLHLTARPNGNHILLEWQTASERNNRGYYIARSTNGTNFQLLNPDEIIPGRNIPNQRYVFADRGVEAGIRYYYQLHQTDMDGSVHYSAIVEAMLAKEIGGMTARFYPNPTTGQLTLNYNIPSLEKLQLKLTNMAGQVVWQQHYTPNSYAGEIEIDLSGLAAGTYQAEVRSGESVIYEKIVRITR
jgi:hypothetical protein